MKKILILLIAASSYAMQAQQTSPSESLVVVTGEGVVKVVPDQVLIRSRIEHEGDNAREVKRQNDEVVNKVLKYLKSQGISDKNIRTDYVNLNKNYNYNEKTYTYAANQSIAIKLEKLADYEKIMSGLLENGLNRIDGVEFQSSRIEEHTSEARKKAVVNAQKKAGEYAGALNQSIGKAKTISEIENNQYPPMYRMEMMKSSADSGAEETIAPGEMQISVKVNVGFILQ